MNPDISLQNERILIFEPHPDDITYNIAGSVIKWIKEGKEIMVCTITTGNNSTFNSKISKEEIKEIMLREHHAAMDLYGIPEDHRIQWQYDDLGLDPARNRESLLNQMVQLIRKFKPVTVITMDPHNILNEENPDHRLVAMTGFEAAALAAYPNFHKEHFQDGLSQHFVARVLFYMSPDPDTYVDIGGEPLMTKIQAGMIYQSQLELMITEIEQRLKIMGLDPDLDAISQEELWAMVCESMAEERALEAMDYYEKNPELKPEAPIEYAEAFRMYYLGAMEKLREYLPKEFMRL